MRFRPCVAFLFGLTLAGLWFCLCRAASAVPHLPCCICRVAVRCMSAANRVTSARLVVFAAGAQSVVAHGEALTKPGKTGIGTTNIGTTNLEFP